MSHKPLMLIFPFNQLAHYLRCLTLARYLEPYFEIKFAHSEEYNSFIWREGYTVFECRSLNAASVIAKVRKFNFSWINEHSLEPVLNDQLRVIRLYKPDLVLGDTSLTLKMAAEKTGIFYISLMNAYMSKYYNHQRPLSPTHPLFKYLKNFPPNILDSLTRIGEKASFKRIHKTFRELRKRNKLNQQHSYPDELEGDLTLLCDLPDLFPQNLLPENYSWVPPLFYNSFIGEPPGLKEKLDPAKKTILVTMGSTGDWRNMTFLNQEHYRKYNIITAGDLDGIVMSYAVRADFVNMEEVLPVTSLVICHGGNGSTYQALMYGIPLLCMPVHFEQEWNIQPLVAAGLAEVLNGKNETEIAVLVDKWVQRRENDVHKEFELKMRHADRELQNSARSIFQQFQNARAS